MNTRRIFHVIVVLVVLFWLSDSTSSEPNWGGAYHGMPQTIDEAMDQEIYLDTMEFEMATRNGGGYSGMSQEEEREYRSVQLCENIRAGMMMVTLGLSILYDCNN